MGKTVALLTDFTEVSDEAFAHALALALAYKHHFYLLHVKNPERDQEWSSFPQVRETLARWGAIDADAAQSEVEAKLGIKVAKVEIASEDIPGSILDFTLKHPTNVIVMATRGRQGLDRLRYGSKAEEIFHRTQVLPAIFIGPEARGSVNVNLRPSDIEYLRCVHAATKRTAQEIAQSLALLDASNALIARIDRQLSWSI